MTWLAGSFPVEPTPPAWEFYDLQEDPQELVNQYANPAFRGIIDELKQQLRQVRAELKETDAAYPDFQKVIDAHWDD